MHDSEPRRDQKFMWKHLILVHGQQLRRYPTWIA